MMEHGVQTGSEALLALSLLKRGDLCGFEMISLLEAASNPTFRMREATIYPILHRLERKGLVCSYVRGLEERRPRRCYRLTRRGARRLSAEE